MITRMIRKELHRLVVIIVVIYLILSRPKVPLLPFSQILCQIWIKIQKEVKSAENRLVYKVTFLNGLDFKPLFFSTFNSK